MTNYGLRVLACILCAMVGATGSWALQPLIPGGPQQQSGAPATAPETPALIIEPPNSSLSLECGGKALEFAKQYECLGSLPKKQQREVELAQQNLQRAERDLKRGNLAAGSQELHTAITVLGALAKSQPEHWEFSDALNYAKELQWEMALPKEQRRMLKNAQNALEAKQWKEAGNIFQQLVAAHAEQPETWVLYDALAYAELKEADATANAEEYGQALKSYEQAIELMQKAAGSGNSGVEKTCGASHMLSNKGYALLAQKENKEAVQAYEQAAPIAHIDPQRTIAYFNLCVAYYYAEDWQNAIHACTQATGANSDNAAAYLVKGKAMIKERWPSPLTGGDKDQAQEAISRYVCLAPSGVHFAEANQWLDYLQAAKPPRCDVSSKTADANVCQ